VFAEQASRDIECFLRARAVELVPGGKLLLQVFGRSDAKRCCDGVYDVLNDAVLEVLSHGMIDRAAYDAYYQPAYFRTLDELTEPVELYSLPFHIDQQETYEAPVPFNDDFARSGNVEVYAREYTNFHRAFTEGVLRISESVLLYPSESSNLSALLSDTGTVSRISTGRHRRNTCCAPSIAIGSYF
jgi:gibberellin A4 carboxyl methyltransferase